MLRSVDVYVAPNTGGESFGIILVEAHVGRCAGPRERPGRLRPGAGPGRGGRPVRQRGRRRAAEAAIRPLGDPERRKGLRSGGEADVRRFDWATVGADILAVYETVTDGAASVAADERSWLRARFGLARD
ncbi:GDP-mannose-dependent alpha-(1-2)-phosphatidylinositol mannosyltransferase [Streptomyces badius]